MAPARPPLNRLLAVLPMNSQIGCSSQRIAPGPVQTGYLTESESTRLAEALCESRVGRPEDVAAAVLYLVSPASAWTTGQVLRVAGGHDL